MKVELSKQLVGKYPFIFANKYGGMCIGDGWYNIIDTLCGLIQHHIDQTKEQRKYAQEYNRMIKSCQEGDFRAFDERHKNQLETPYIQTLRGASASGAEKLQEVPKEVKQVTAAQVKEKFGGLRFYIDGGDQYIYGLIQMAEQIAFYTCQECGDAGTTKGSKGWIGVLCPTHRKLYNDQIKRQANANPVIEASEFTDEELVGALYDYEGVITEQSIKQIYKNRKSKE